MFIIFSKETEKVFKEIKGFGSLVVLGFVLGVFLGFVHFVCFVCLFFVVSFGFFHQRKVYEIPILSTYPVQAFIPSK